MSKTLSLTNSKDLICNSLRIIHGDELLDVFELFLLKSEGADIVGISPESLNTLQEIANAIGNDAQFFSNINTQLSTKANITDVYTKSYRYFKRRHFHKSSDYITIEFKIRQQRHKFLLQ